MKRLKEYLNRIDKKSYKLYKNIKGKYNFGRFSLEFVHIQGDPFASPTTVKIESDIKEWSVVNKDIDDELKILAVSDYINRIVYRYLSIYSSNLGTGKSGLLRIQKPSQKILKRSSVIIKDGTIKLYIKIGLPAYGRKIDAKNAIKLFDNLYESINKSMNAVDRDNIEKWKKVVKDYYFIKEKLKEKGLVAFIGNRSVLPRLSGIDEKPKRDDVVPFISPPSLEVSFYMPDGEIIKGMGIKKGITLITGGGFHGKSTLLKAIESGVYPHIPSDGRELCVTVWDAVKIKSEEGRYIDNTDISPFISHLPQGIDTKNFSTENASGSTSQSASIMEAMEIGTSLLLIDEDTSATNFMIRDERMQKLIAKEKEPITPFIDRCREMYDKLGISSIIVMGGSGDYLDIADTVIMMDSYKCKDVTDKAKEIVKEYPLKREKESKNSINKPENRILNKKIRFNKVKNRGVDYLLLDKEEIDIKNIDQIYEEGQVRFIGEIIKEIMKNNDKSIVEILRHIYNNKIDRIFSLYTIKDISYIRMHEVFFAITRCRKLKFSRR